MIFHLAAQGEVRKSIEEPVFDAASNVVGTVNVLEAARRFSTKRVVSPPTGGAIYGEGSRIELPADESALLAPLCPYGQSKLAAEGYLDLYRRMCGPGVPQPFVLRTCTDRARTRKARRARSQFLGTF